MVMVELESTESTPTEEVTPVVCIISEFSLTDCKRSIFTFYSHPGYFGKHGMRHFHYKKNQYHCPTLNLDKLWSLVSEQTRLNAEKSKDKAAVIDVTKAVNYYYILTLIRASSKSQARENYPRFPSLSRPSSSQRLLKRESRKLEVLANQSHELKQTPLSLGSDQLDSKLRLSPILSISLYSNLLIK